MKKPAVPKANSPFERTVKERLELIAGERGDRIKPLNPDTATTADLANKINELIELLQ